MNNLVLAITTIEDLLLEHKLTECPVEGYDDVHLSVPEYQRPYKWTEKNALQLFDDIVDARHSNRERYRVGTLILHQKDEAGKATYDIVDGQQRVITFSLLLSAFDDKNVPDFLLQSLSNNSYNRRNVPGNYRALKRRVEAIADKRERTDLHTYVLENCEFIVVITSELPEAFQFFDSQNARGKKLYPHDLLKAYHLREMRDVGAAEVEAVVSDWEELKQERLSALFSDYLYCIKCWVRDNRADVFTERDIQMFKGVNRRSNYPYAQYYKGAYSFAHSVNNSAVPFVAGMQDLRPFQLDSPIIAGLPFFEYARYYFAILDDIQNNSKYEGYFINDNDIVKTLDLPQYRNGVGNRVTRRLFDTALLLYVDRFCPSHPNRQELEMFDEFVRLAFVWAYSLRAQYVNLGWAQAQNYVTGSDAAGKNQQKKNSLNIYKAIVESDSPRALSAALSERMVPLKFGDVLQGSKGRNSRARSDWSIDEKKNGVYTDYLHFFSEFHFLEDVPGGAR